MTGDRPGASVTAYYLLALALSWAGWIPFAAAQAGVLAIRVPVEVGIIAQFGPTVAALFLVLRAEGGAGLREFLVRSCRWRIAPRLYGVALLLTPAIALVWLFVHGTLGGDVPAWSDLGTLHGAYVQAFGSTGPYGLEDGAPPSAGPITFLQELIRENPWWALANFTLFAILTGPVSEEFGWRGYAQPRLQARWSALKAAIVVGILWGLWHTGPDFWRLLFLGDLRAFLYPLAITLGTLPLSILLAWLYNRTGGSLLPGMLLHASFNSTVYILSLVWTDMPPLLIGAELVAGLWVAAIMVVVRNGGATLTGRTTGPTVIDRVKPRPV